MRPETKVTLSDAELSLFGDAAIILTKNHILHQTRELLTSVQQQLGEQAAAASWPSEYFAVAPKISRGENYLGLPWLVLDYPRNFGAVDVFAIRSFFWWGHFFSSTLQLSGTYNQRFASRLAGAHSLLASRHYFLHTGTDPWAHHFGADNYTPIASLTEAGFAALLYRQAPIKIAAKWPLQQWQFAANNLSASWELLLRLCFD